MLTEVYRTYVLGFAGAQRNAVIHVSEEESDMVGVTRKFAIAKTMEILRAYVRKIEDAKGYFDCLSPEGRKIVENYDNNVDGQKTLLLDACNNDKFFSGMTDEMVIAYADVCRKLNDRFDLNVKKVYPIEKITADLSLFEKIKKAIGYSDILGEILEEVGDINALVKQMAVVSGGLIALSFTGLGTVAEALGLALLLVGASFSGTELLAGITGLVKFFTEVYNAKTEEDLKVCGKLFGDAVAKIGVHGLFFVLSLFGLKKASIRHTTRTIADSNPVSGKWERKSFKENVLKIGEAKAGKIPQIEGIVGKKANELTAVPDDYVLVHYTDGEGILQTSIRRRKSNIGEFLFVDEKGYVSRTKDVKYWKRENTVGSTPGKTSKTGQTVIKRYGGK